MTEKEYKRKTLRELKGTKVKSLVELRTKEAIFPKGTIFTIKNKRGGFALTTEECPTCGLKLFIHHVPPSEVELI